MQQFDKFVPLILPCVLALAGLFIQRPDTLLLDVWLRLLWAEVGFFTWFSSNSLSQTLVTPQVASKFGSMGIVGLVCSLLAFAAMAWLRDVANKQGASRTVTGTYLITAAILTFAILGWCCRSLWSFPSN